MKADITADTGRTVVLSGSPNVGKSTVFNGLTGMNQHTGNWPGKTVSSAVGKFRSPRRSYTLIDTPGAYSLFATSVDEEIARDCICSGAHDAVVVVCDATCLERNLGLVLQTLESARNVIVCINLMDEAARKHIRIDLALISEQLGVPVVGVTARKRRTLALLVSALDSLFDGDSTAERPGRAVRYIPELESAIEALLPALDAAAGVRADA